jgi:hypothetical protein
MNSSHKVDISTKIERTSKGYSFSDAYVVRGRAIGHLDLNKVAKSPKVVKKLAEMAKKIKEFKL